MCSNRVEVSVVGLLGKGECGEEEEMRKGKEIEKERKVWRK